MVMSEVSPQELRDGPGERPVGYLFLDRLNGEQGRIDGQVLKDRYRRFVESKSREICGRIVPDRYNAAGYKCGCENAVHMGSRKKCRYSYRIESFNKDRNEIRISRIKLIENSSSFRITGDPEGRSCNHFEGE